MVATETRTPASEIEDRIHKLQSELGQADVDGALIVQRADLFYFTGTIQMGHLYVPREGDPIYLVNKSYERAREESPLERMMPLGSLKKLLPTLKEQGYELPKTLGMELDVLPANLYFSYKKLCDTCDIVDVSHPIRLLRSVKSTYELQLMREAAKFADQVSAFVPEVLREGMTELELAGRLEAEARRLGHQGVMRMRLWGNELHFGHVMSGPAAAIPSYLSSPTGGTGASPAIGQGPSFKPINRHEPVLVDYVFAYRGYMADHTRIFSLGDLPDDLNEAHQAMLGIQEMVKQNAKPGTKAGDLFEMALERTRELGYENNFMGVGPDRVHFVGHGIGTEVDEYPFLARRQELELKEGMTIALEPKVVFPEKGVVGIENTHVVTPDGLEQLTIQNEDIVFV
jgi:Xaa-Pro aminopeptidase